MAINVLCHKVQKELTFLISQKLKHGFRLNVPPGGVNEGECEPVLAHRRDRVQMIFKCSLKHMDLKTLISLCIPPKLFHSLSTLLTEAKPNL